MVRIMVGVRVSVRVNSFRNSFSVLLCAQHYSMLTTFSSAITPYFLTLYTCNISLYVKLILHPGSF